MNGIKRINPPPIMIDLTGTPPKKDYTQLIDLTGYDSQESFNNFVSRVYNTMFINVRPLSDNDFLDITRHINFLIAASDKGDDRTFQLLIKMWQYSYESAQYTHHTDAHQTLFHYLKASYFGTSPTAIYLKAKFFESEKNEALTIACLELIIQQSNDQPTYAALQAARKLEAIFTNIKKHQLFGNQYNQKKIDFYHQKCNEIDRALKLPQNQRP